MRRFIRHPASMPIQFELDSDGESHREQLKDVSEGGMCFSASDALEPGSKISLMIRVRDRDLQVQGLVKWCHPSAKDYVVGVSFDDSATFFAVRMVEQICYIEDYRKRIAKEEGRDLTGEQAAVEWIERFAADFPD